MVTYQVTGLQLSSPGMPSAKTLSYTPPTPLKSCGTRPPSEQPQLENAAGPIWAPCCGIQPAHAHAQPRQRTRVQARQSRAKFAAATDGRKSTWKNSGMPWDHPPVDPHVQGASSSICPCLTKRIIGPTERIFVWSGHQQRSVASLRTEAHLSRRATAPPQSHCFTPQCTQPSMLHPHGKRAGRHTRQRRQDDIRPWRIAEIRSDMPMAAQGCMWAAACTQCFLALTAQPPRPPPPCPRYPALPPLGSTHIPIDWRGDLSLGGSRTNAGSTHSELIFTRKVVQIYPPGTQSPGTSTNSPFRVEAAPRFRRLRFRAAEA